ncbi:hypothetical protein [Pyrococcus sp. NA2]|nr:hypothetical protein [Pyrococcus sp. NA2]
MLKIKPEPMVLRLRKVEMRIENWEENREEKVKVRLITNVKRVQLS